MMKQSLWAIAAAAFFSLMAAFVKLSSPEHGPVEMLFYRSLFGVIVISVFVWTHRSTHTLKTQHIGGHIKRSVLGCTGIIMWFYTLGKMDFGTNVTLSYTTPLFMAANFLILALWRRRPVPWAMLGAIIIGFIGVTAVLQPSFNRDELVPALVCLAFSALGLLIYWQMKELGNLKEPAWRIVFYFTAFCTVTGFAGCLLFEDGFSMPTPTGLIGILGMGLCATLGQMSTTKSYAYGNLLLSSCLSFSAIPFSALIGWLWFGETLTLSGFVGMALILVSGVAASVTTKRAEAIEARQEKGA